MLIVPTAIPEVRIVEPRVFGDRRGYFMETWTRRDFEAAGIGVEFVQDNESSSMKGVLRGLHYQAGPAAQAKLVRVVAGAVFDVAVDLRRGSPTFGRWVGEVLSGENKRQLFIPRGFAHGFLCLEDRTVFTYRCDNLYAPEAERGIRYDDPDIAVAWPLHLVEGLPLTLSDKDRRLPAFSAVPEADLF